MLALLLLVACPFIGLWAGGQYGVLQLGDQEPTAVEEFEVRTRYGYLGAVAGSVVTGLGIVGLIVYWRRKKT